MFVCSVKASTLKFIISVAATLTVLALVIILVPDYDSGKMTAAIAKSRVSLNFEKIKTEEDRVKFLEQFGWTVKEGGAVDEAEITLPDEFDRVMRSYNELQKGQGFNLEKYKKRTLTRYTYEITNYPDYTGTVYANVIIYKNKVVGGDICSADVKGFITGFVMPPA